MNEKINKQGESVRNLKSQKAAKQDIDAAVKILLELKTEYKTLTGQDWKPSATVAAPPTKQEAKPASTGSSGQAGDLNEKITKQGDVVRVLKTQKASKADIDTAVKTLLDLKAQYKAATGQDWKPGTVTAPVEVKKEVKVSVGQVSDLNEKIILQGDTVRNLKTQKAAKQDVDAAVKLLLQLKGEYKTATGQDWKPQEAPKVDVKKPSVGQTSDLNEKINLQGDSVRNLKSQKAAKQDIDAAVKILLELKGEYKKLTGQDWKPQEAPKVEIKKDPKSPSIGQASDLNEKINLQGDTVRNLKSQKAAKLDVDAAVKILLELKGEYKKLTGQDWKPGTVVAPVEVKKEPSVGQTSDLNEKIIRQGDSVRNLKSQKAAKQDIDAAVKLLLELKAEYKKLTGQEWKPQEAPKVEAKKAQVSKFN